ncbi:MAG: hypothetical protein HRU33_08715 [Rhodobacteraceae bacterium]|nr:hypothetical protein [Paracoccaceae bacterium]
MIEGKYCEEEKFSKFKKIKGTSKPLPAPFSILLQFAAFTTRLTTSFLKFLYSHFLKKTLTGLSQLVGIGVATWIILQFIAVTDEILILSIAPELRLDQQELFPGDIVSVNPSGEVTNVFCNYGNAPPLVINHSYRVYSVIAEKDASFGSFFEWLQNILGTKFPTDRTVTASWLQRDGHDRPILPSFCVEKVTASLSTGGFVA